MSNFSGFGSGSGSFTALPGEDADLALAIHQQIDQDLASKGDLRTPGAYKDYVNGISAQLGPIDGQIKDLTEKQKLGIAQPADLQKLAALQAQRDQINSAAFLRIGDAVKTHGAAALGLGNNQVALITKALSNGDGLTIHNLDVGSLLTASPQSDKAAANALQDAADKVSAAQKATDDQAKADQASKAAADKAQAGATDALTSVQSSFDAANKYADSLVNTGLNTFDQQLGAQKAQAASTASSEGQQLGLGAAQAADNTAQANLDAKGAAQRGTLSTDLTTAAGNYLGGVLGQGAKELAGVQGLSTSAQAQFQGQSADTLVNEIGKLRQSGEISATGNENEISNLLNQYQNENTSAENKQALAKKIIALGLGAGGAVAGAFAGGAPGAAAGFSAGASAGGAL